MKKTRYVVIGLICICLVVGYYAFLSYKSSNSDEVEVSEVQKLILKDLSTSYPATPREVIKFYNRIVTCFYNEDFTDEELHQLTDQMRILMAQELADNNPSEQYYQRVADEVNAYHASKRTISNTTVSDTNDIETVEVDGQEYAYVNSSYLVRETGKVMKTNQKYILSKDDEGKWKILAFQLADEESAANE